MRIRIIALIILLIGSVAVSKAQDTASPMMSQRAYDSTLRALKKAATLKQKDTAKAKDTVKVSSQPAKPDTSSKPDKGLPDEMIKQVNDITGGVPIVKKDSVRRDTVKKHKSKYMPTGYLALAFGEGYPKGDFLANGYPSKGGAFSAIAAFPGIVSRFGLIFRIDYGWNGVNKLRFIDSLKSTVANPNLSYSMPDQSFKYTYKTILGGLYYTWPISSKLSVDARLLCGIMMATIPGISVEAHDVSNGNTLTVNTFQASGRSFALCEGISVRYLVIPQLSVMLNIDNESADPSFVLSGNGITTNLNGTAITSDAQSETGSQSFHLLNVSVGVGYTINARK